MRPFNIKIHQHFQVVWSVCSHIKPRLLLFASGFVNSNRSAVIFGCSLFVLIYFLILICKMAWFFSGMSADKAVYFQIVAESSINEIPLNTVLSTEANHHCTVN